MEIDKEKFDEVVLAMLYYGSWDEDEYGPRVWKSFDWDSLGRLYEKELIRNPVGKAKSLTLTLEGAALGAQLLEKHFGKIKSES